MKASELRIGNYVSFLSEFSSVWSKVIINDGLELNQVFKYPNKFRSIPITEDWLVKFGFEKVDKFIKYGNGADWQPDYPRTIFNGFKLEIPGNNYFVYFTSESKWKNKETNKIESYIGVSIVYGDFYSSYEGSDVICCVIPKYVHQLQNLYFALTGNELKLKE